MIGYILLSYSGHVLYSCIVDSEIDTIFLPLPFYCVVTIE